MRLNLTALLIFLLVIGCTKHVKEEPSAVLVPAPTIYSPACLTRTLPNGKKEYFNVYDKDVFEPSDHIQIYSELNHACSKADACYVAVDDRIGVRKFGSKVHSYMVSRRSKDSAFEKETISMDRIQSGNSPRYLKGADIIGTKYFLMYLGPGVCSHNNAPRCDKYLYEIFTVQQDKQYQTPEEGVWTNSACSSQPTQPGGGSGEDPPKDPG